MVVWGTEKEVRHIILVSKTWGIFYRANQFSTIYAREPGATIKTAWAASLTDDKQYDTIFGAEVTDERIKKIVVTNEGFSANASSLDEAKKQSSVYVEIDVENGFAVHYMNLPPSSTGNFVFRGLDGLGNMLATGF